jgi:hypothetical protein
VNLRNKPTYFTFYLYLNNGSIRRATKRLSVTLRDIHVATLRKVKRAYPVGVLRLETCYMDHLGKLRAMVSDYRT